METALWTMAIVAILFLVMRLGTAWAFRERHLGLDRMLANSASQITLTIVAYTSATFFGAIALIWFLGSLVELW
jgi:multisubunit Na+/H+ antiporter MnhF subunit